MQVTLLLQLLNTKFLNVIRSWIWFISCLLTFLLTISSKFLKAETKMLSACVSQLPLRNSANKSAATMRERMKVERVGEGWEMWVKRFTTSPSLSLLEELYHSSWHPQTGRSPFQSSPPLSSSLDHCMDSSSERSQKTSLVLAQMVGIKSTHCFLDWCEGWRNNWTPTSFAVSVFCCVFERRRRRRRGRITWYEEAWWILQREGVAIKEENRKRQQHQGINQQDSRKLKGFRGTLTRSNCQVEYSLPSLPF